MDWANVLVRFALYLNLMLVFGLPFFILYSLKSTEHGSVTATKLVATSRLLAILAILLSIAGLIISTKMMSGANSYLSIAQGAFSIILLEMPYGTAWIVRLICLGLFFILAGTSLVKRSSLQLIAISILGAIALATLAWGGHGAMDENVKGIVHLGADIAHLIAVGTWIGAIASFLLIIRFTPKDGRAEVERLERMLKGFAIIGSIIVAALIVTGTINYIMISGLRLTSLFTTQYGTLLLIKLTIFLAMLALAAANRYRLTPMLEASIAKGNHGPAILVLKRSLIIEASCAMLILALIAYLGMLSPQVPG